MEDTHNYSLAFKVEKRNPMTVEISKIDSNFENFNTKSIEVIDAFTSKYTIEQLMDIIRKSNTLTEDYLNGELIVIDNTTGWRYPPIVNQGFENISLVEFLIQNKTNKTLMNKIYNKASKHAKDEETNHFTKQLFLEETDILLFLTSFKSLPYLMRREIKLLCFELSKENEENQKNKKLKKAS